MDSEIKNRFFHLTSTKAVDVYLETRKKKIYVGRLTRQAAKGSVEYVFSYDEKYFRSERAFSLGPEFPLTARRFTSDTLFEPFIDRIPSKENAAYGDYCNKFGISPLEKDEFVLLVTIASRGPSSFVFEPVFETAFSGMDAKAFRLELGLTVREFSAAFDVSLATVTKLENGGTTGRDILKRIEIYARFPVVALFEIEKRSSTLKDDVREKLVSFFEARTGSP